MGTTERRGRPPTTLYINNGVEPGHLDPGLATDTASFALIYQLFEGLTGYDPADLHPTQGVAERWDLRPDGLVYRFHLRADARWSDGRPVTALDFEYSWKRVLRPSLGSAAAPAFYPIRNAEPYNLGVVKDEAAVGVRALDDRTLEVELERPTPYFLDLTGSTAFMPVRRDVVEAPGHESGGERWTRPGSIVTNGPYALDYWRFRDEIGMRKNPFYWNRDAVRTERLVFLEVESSATALSLYKTGEIDLYGENVSIPPAQISYVQARKDALRFEPLVVYWYELNTRRPPLDDPRVRTALDISVDKALLTRTIVKGAIPAHHYVPDSTGLGYSQQAAADRAAGIDPFSGPGIDFDPERARALLREAGHEVRKTAEGWDTPGFPLMEILYNQGQGHHEIAVALQDMWRRHLGIRTLLQGKEWKVLLSERDSGSYHIVRDSWVADYNHPHTFLETFVSTSPNNHPGWASAAYDAAIREAQATRDPAASMRLYRRAEQIAMGGRARIPLYFFADTTLVKPYVRGYHGNARGIHPLQYAWIDPDWQHHPGNAPAAAPLELPPPGSIEPPR